MRVNLAASPDVLVAPKLAAGLTITSASAPALNATYPLDLMTLLEITAIEASLARGDGLPLGLATVAFHDVSNTEIVFSEGQFIAWAKAVRDYFTGLKQTARALAAGRAATWPASAAAIP